MNHVVSYLITSSGIGKYLFYISEHIAREKFHNTYLFRIDRKYIPFIMIKIIAMTAIENN